MTRELKKFYVFSDESGSWHEDHERSIYLRSWIVITKEEYKKLKQIINEISSDIDCDELKWKSLSGPQGMSHINAFSELNFRIFITISSPADINWEEKYNITSNYQREISQLGFGNLDEDIVEELQNKILKDIKYTLFLNFYERTHIENVVKRIEDSINLDEYNLEYKIDPSQSNNSDWRGVLTSITDKNLEFPESHKAEGIQFADVVAGAFKSIIMNDEKHDEAVKFCSTCKDCIYGKDRNNPNPNLIFFQEVNEKIKNGVKKYEKIAGKLHG